MSFVCVEKDGGVAVITIDRIKNLNALNQNVLLELRQQLLELENIRVVVITGAGEKAFVAGADIASMVNMSALQARAFVELGQGVMQLLEEAPFISLAAVNGFALGGGLELALACDLIYASEKAEFGLPETNLGIIPGFGGTVNLSRRVGMHRAMEMILTGRRILAKEAKQEGLVLEVYSSADLLPKVKELAHALAQKGIHSLLAARRLIRSHDAIDKDRAFLLERETFATLFATKEPEEGMTAFLEKRVPQFSHLYNQTNEKNEGRDK